MQGQIPYPERYFGKEVTPKDITGDMFTKESYNVVDEVKLKVVDVTPSSQTEGSEDGSPGSLSYQEVRLLCALIADCTHYRPFETESCSSLQTTKEPKESENK
ncbi:hypothetical protein EJB05_25417 [Eragrostis curvula]|uniref:Uncharacterized protein n=1 Tax=Eragrostis curvula TaxID=38414 RepID=A0A5J9VBE0_9POAL|nr:hypothetical protein EJB05_25417 [Eragrostis curvula]